MENPKSICILPRNHYTIKVKTREEQNKMDFGRWITSSQLSRNCVSAEPPSPAPHFRHTFECSGFTTGRVHLAGVGYHELYLNGRKVGDRVLDPTVSCYEKRVRFVTFDITEYLHPGVNVVGVILGNGWYNPSTAEVWNFFKAPWRDCVKFTLQLEIDGEIVLESDESWKCASGPILFDALRNGETYDARRELDGWLGERYDDSAWGNTMWIAGPGGVLDEQKMPPCKVLQTIPAVLHPAGKVYDVGQNLSGWARIAVQGEAGAEVKLEYAERITEDGDLDTSFQDIFIQSGDFQTDRYILKGGGIESWEPRFTYHGFQYIRVTITGNAELCGIEARFVGTAFDSIGGITTSDETLNQLQKMTRWSFRSNYVGIPTDCPHREKNGWTGDAAIAADTGLYNFDVGSSYAEWLQLLADCQRMNGQLPGIAPTGGWGFDWGSGPAWDCALFSIPYEIYLHTGDDTAIRQNYPAMKRYLDFCGTMESDGILAFGLGDWAAPEPCGNAPSPALTSTGYYYMDARRMEYFSKVLEKPDEEARYRDLAERIRAAFNRRFHLGDGLYGDGSGRGELTSLGCALYHELVEPAFRQRTLERLVALCRENDWRILRHPRREICSAGSCGKRPCRSCLPLLHAAGMPRLGPLDRSRPDHPRRTLGWNRFAQPHHVRRSWRLVLPLPRRVPARSGTAGVPPSDRGPLPGGELLSCGISRLRLGVGSEGEGHDHPSDRAAEFDRSAPPAGQ